jgi:hypothetical protein
MKEEEPSISQNQKKRDRKKRRRAEGKADDEGDAAGAAAASPEARGDGRHQRRDGDGGASGGGEPAAASGANSQPRKRRAKDPKPPGEPPEAEMSERSTDSEDGDDDDEYLRREAEAWARKHDGDDAPALASTCPPKKKPAQPGNRSPAEEQRPSPARQQPEQEQRRSVHVTQVPFSATELDVRRHFAEGGGCLVSSVRLVYDRGIDRDRQFRGVAFVDVADEASFAAALRLDRTRMAGRRINVRPTRSASELSEIVKETRKRIAGGKLGGAKDGKLGGTNDGRGRGGRRGGGGRRPAAKAPSGSEKQRPRAGGARRSEGQDGAERKPAKRERNRRAAILRQGKRPRKS